MITLDTTNGHNTDVVARFNKVSEKFSDDEILYIILTYWADDEDLKCITSTLKDFNHERARDQRDIQENISQVES